jgi:hypothetical protein
VGYKNGCQCFGGTTMAFKFRLKGTDGDFWAIIPGMENRGGWYTVTIPLTDFKDNDGYGTNILPNVQNITQDFGLATAGDAGFVNMCIDNVRFEKISKKIDCWRGCQKINEY